MRLEAAAAIAEQVKAAISSSEEERARMRLEFEEQMKATAAQTQKVSQHCTKPPDKTALCQAVPIASSTQAQMQEQRDARGFCGGTIVPGSKVTDLRPMRLHCLGYASERQRQAKWHRAPTSPPDPPPNTAPTTPNNQPWCSIVERIRAHEPTPVLTMNYPRINLNHCPLPRTATSSPTSSGAPRRRPANERRQRSSSCATRPPTRRKSPSAARRRPRS